MTNYDRMWSMMDQHRFEIDRADLPDDVTCVICQKLLVDAHQGPCGCNYCRRCVEGLVGTGEARCPGGDRDCLSEELTLYDKVIKDHSANKRVSKLIVECISDKCDNRTDLYNLECCINNCKAKRIFSSKEKNKITKDKRKSNESDRSDTILKIEEGIRINKKIKTIIGEGFEELKRLKEFQKYIINGLSNQDIEIPLTSLHIKDERCEMNMVERIPSGQETVSPKEAGSSVENRNLIDKLRRELTYLRMKRDEQDKEKIILISENRMLLDEMVTMKSDTKHDDVGSSCIGEASIESHKESVERDKIDRTVINLKKERDQQDKEKIILISQKKMLEEELDFLKNRIKCYNTASLGEECKDMDQRQECIGYKNETDKLRKALNVLKKRRDKQDKEKIILISQKQMLEEELNQMKNSMEHHDHVNICTEGTNDEIEKIKKALRELRKERDTQEKEKIILISQKKMLEDELNLLTKDPTNICVTDTDQNLLNKDEVLQDSLTTDIEHSDTEEQQNETGKLKEALRNIWVKTDEQDKEKILLVSQKKILEEELEMLRNNMKQRVHVSVCTGNTEVEEHHESVEIERIKEKLTKLKKERDEQDKEKIVLIRQKRMLEVKLQETENERKDVINCNVKGVESTENDNKINEGPLHDKGSIDIEQRNKKKESSKYHGERNKLKRALIDLRKKRDKQDKEKIILISQKQMLEEELNQMKNSMEHQDHVSICTEGTNDEIEKIKRALKELRKERDAQEKEKIILISQKKMLEDEWRMYKEEEKDVINYNVKCLKTSENNENVFSKQELKGSDPEEVIRIENESNCVLYMQPVVRDLHTDVSEEYSYGEHSPPIGLIKSFATLKTKILDIKLMKDNHGWIRSENLYSINDNYQMWILSNFGGCTDHFGSHFCFGFNIKATENSVDRAWPFTCVIDITIGDDRKKKRSLKHSKHIRFHKSNYQLFHPGEVFHFSYQDIDLLELIQQNSIILECNVDKLG